MSLLFFNSSKRDVPKAIAASGLFLTVSSANYLSIEFFILISID